MEKRRSKRFNLSSFPQYVNRVQSKMNELKLQSLANAQKYDHYQQRELAAGKRGRSPRAPAAAAQPVELNSKRPRPLPRTLSPLKTKISASRGEWGGGNAGHFEDKSRGGSGEGLRRARRSAQQCAGETVWGNDRRQFPVGLTQQLHNAVRGPHLTLPFQRMPGASVNSLSSGSSSASSNSSTPFPPSPSPVTFLTPSKTSISSSEQSPPTQKKCLDNIHLIKYHNKAPSISALNQLNASSNSLDKSASVPQLRNRSAPKSPLDSSPSPAPACSPYLMPITRLKPATRPKRESKSSSSRNGKKRFRKSSHSESSKSLNTPEQPAKVATLQQTTSMWCPMQPSSIAVPSILPPISTGEDTNMLKPGIAFSDVDPIGQQDSSCGIRAPGLMIPTIMIRSATPIRSPSADESLASLCETYVCRTELAQELKQLKSDLKDLSETNSAPSS